MFRPAFGSNSLFQAPRDKPRAGPFAGAACLKNFVAIHAPRKIARGPLVASQSGSPPVRSPALPDLMEHLRRGVAVDQEAVHKAGFQDSFGRFKFAASAAKQDHLMFS
jgi:hypothetical protein